MATNIKSRGRKFGNTTSKKVGKTTRERKPTTGRKQAIAPVRTTLTEARRSGTKLPKRKSTAKKK